MTSWCPKSIRQQILTEQNHKCNRCHLDKWLDHPLILELEHKDGNNTNHSRDNLEYLCPNCHSLTKTWRGRNKTGKSNKRIKVEGFPSIRQYLISIGLSPKGKNYETVKKKLSI